MWVCDTREPLWQYSNLYGEFQPCSWLVIPLSASPGLAGEMYSPPPAPVCCYQASGSWPLALVTPHNINHKSNLSAKQSHGTAPLQVSQRHSLTVTVCKPLTHLSSRIDSRLRSLMLNGKTWREKQVCVGRTCSFYRENKGRLLLLPHKMVDSRWNKVLSVNGKLQS